MKIGFDVSNLATNRADGSTRYTRELARRLPSLRSEHEWLYFAPAAEPAEVADQPHSASVRWYSLPWPKYWTQSRLPFALFRTKPDVLLMPMQQIPYFRPGRTKTIAAVMDLAVHHYPEQFTYKDWLLLHIFSAYVAREADHLIAISEATARDIERFYGRTKNVHVIHLGVDHDTFFVRDEATKATAWEEIAAAYPTLTKPYLLYVGQLQPRKNIGRLVEAFEKLHADQPDLQLVIAGAHGWMQGPILERIERSPLRSQILLTGRVPEKMLPTLYSHAEVCILPSLYEGFGLPILEAMACGCPVVTSNVSSMPEVAGEAAILIDPLHTESLVQGIRQAQREAPLLRAKGLVQAQKFTWEKAVKQTLQVIESQV